MTTILHENMESKYLKDKLHNASHSFYEKDKLLGWSGGWHLLFQFFLKSDTKQSRGLIAFEVCFGVGCVVGTVSV